MFHEVELLRGLTDVPGENLVIVHDVMMTVDDVTLFIWDHFTGEGVELGNALHRIEAVVAMVAGAGTGGLGCRAFTGRYGHLLDFVCARPLMAIFRLKDGIEFTGKLRGFFLKIYLEFRAKSCFFENIFVPLSKIILKTCF